jgi:hypothetical protein
MSENKFLYFAKGKWNRLFLFAFFWLLAFILYLPAAKAGFVGDFPAWLDHIRNSSFKDYINWNICGVKVLYQFTQFVTYIIYKLFGVNPWAWHLTQLTMHVANVTLLYKITRRLFVDFNIKHPSMAAFMGALLFCISPYASEVIVYKPCFHISMALLMMLLILSWTQRYIKTGQKKFIWLSAFIYFFSTYSLELFYVTPFFTLTLVLFYYLVNKIEQPSFKKTILFFLLPQIILLCAQLGVFYTVYGYNLPHSLSAGNPLVYLTNPPKYLFHILFLGRFLSHETREAVYTVCGKVKFIALFYGCIILICTITIARFRRISSKGKIASLIFTWCMLSFLFTSPLWFYDLLYIIYDRYAYFPAAFTYMLLSIIISYFPKYIGIPLLSVFAIFNIYGTMKNNNCWYQSAAISNKLLRNFPEAGDKTVILLNCPQCMKGALMIRAIGESEYKQMHNLLLPQKINNKVYDAVSYNLLTPNDGAHVMVINDSMLRVTLNQWGTWWWYNDHGAFSYENDDYKLNMVDEGHWYDLTLKHTADQYLLLYEVGDKWKTVDWNKKNIDQY